MSQKLKMKPISIITAIILLFVAFLWVGCVPVPVPGAGLVSVPVSEIISKELGNQRAEKESLLQAAVAEAWDAAPLRVDYAKGTEDGWVDTAIMARAWKIVSAQLKRATPPERNTLLSAAATYYPDRPELSTLLHALGATADGSSWGARPHGAPTTMDEAVNK